MTKVLVQRELPDLNDEQAEALTSGRTMKVDTQPNPQSTGSLETLARVAGLVATVLLLAACAGASQTPKPDITPEAIVTPSSPDATSTVTAPPTPEATNNPEVTFEQKIDAYLSGTHPIPNGFLKDGKPAPENIVKVKEYSDATISQKEYFLHNVLIGEKVIYDSQNRPHLMAAIGLRDSSPEDLNNPGRGRIVVLVNLGRPGTNDKDMVLLNRNNAIDAPDTTASTNIVSLNELQSFLEPYNGRNEVIGIYSVTGAYLESPDLPTDGRSRAEYRAQTPVVDALVSYLTIISTKSVDEAPLDDVLKNAVITSPGEKLPELFDPEAFPAGDEINPSIIAPAPSPSGALQASERP